MVDIIDSEDLELCIQKELTKEKKSLDREVSAETTSCECHVCDGYNFNCAAYEPIKDYKRK